MARGYFRNNLIAIDQLLNTATGGHPDETLSSRTGREAKNSKFWRALEIVIDAMFHPFQGPNHCWNAYLKEMTRYHFPPEMRA
jgi:hypothetical protein